MNKQSKKVNKHQNKKYPKKNTKKQTLTPAQFADMNQIDWYPVDPYCD